MSSAKKGRSASHDPQPWETGGAFSFADKLARIRRIKAEVKKLKPRLKRWAKKLITKDDWDFFGLFRLIEKEQAVLPEALAEIVPVRALRWETDRELGSGNGPFIQSAQWDRGPEGHEPGVLHLGRENGEVAHVQIEPPPWANEPIRLPLQLHAWPLGKLSQLVTPDTISASRDFYTIYAIEIPIIEDDDDVVEGFRLWLGRVRRGNKKRPARRTGRRREWRTCFTDLAIHRLSTSGYKRSEVFEFLGGSQRSAPNFSRSKRLARNDITARYQSLLSQARINSVLSPGTHSADWRDYFSKP